MVAFDLFSGFSTLTLKKPTQPLPTQPPHEICLHGGEDEGQYQSFLKVIAELGLSFKFLPEGASSSWQNAYQNLDVSPEASQWDLIMGEEGKGIDDSVFGSSILRDINDYFSWDAIKSIGGSQSYSQISGGSIGSFSDEDAFNFMCSMTESRERVFSALTAIFGDAEKLDAHEDLDGNGIDDVIDHITSFFAQYVQVDSHNIVLLNLFCGMQTDLVSAVDAFMNCQTYWGGDGTGNILMSKVDNYISSLSGGQKEAALELESMWLNHMPGWDNLTKDINDADLRNTEGSWVKFFRDKMDAINNEDAIRSVVSHIMNSFASQKYNRDKAEYETKKDDMMQDEIWQQRMQAKAIAESKKSVKKLVARSASFSKAIRAQGLKKSSAAVKRASVSGVRGSASVAARRAPAVTVARPAARTTPSHLAAGTAARRAAPVRGIKGGTSASMGAHAGGSQGKRNASVQPKPQSQPSQAQKYAKDEKKVI